MAITFGSLRHTTSGRKRKPLPKTKRYTPKFEELETRPSYRRETTYYPSMKETGAYAPAPDNSYKAPLFSLLRSPWPILSPGFVKMTIFKWKRSREVRCNDGHRIFFSN